MQYTQRRTPFGTENILTGADAAANNQGEGDAARAAAAEALRQQLALQAQMHQGDLAERGASRMQQGRQFDKGLSFQGNESELNRSFTAERDMFQGGLAKELDSSATTRAYGLADRQNVAPLAGIQLQRDQFNATDWKNQAAKGMFEQYMAKRAQPTGGMPGDDQGENDLMMSIISGQPPVDRQQREINALQIEDLKRNKALAQVTQLADAGDVAAAEALAKQAGVGVPRKNFGNPEESMKELKAAVQAFAAKDDQYTGWDPTNADVSRLDTMASRVVELLMKQNRLPKDEAERIVKQAIQESVAGHVGNTGTGWIDTLMQQRGIQ